MVESQIERDILNETRTVYVGDDTGLLKKVKIIVKRQEKTSAVSYGQEIRTQVKRRRMSNGEFEDVVIEKKKGALTAEDDQVRVSYSTEVQYKQTGKYFEQVKD